MNISTTLDYYNQNAKEFALGTVSVDFHETQNKFLTLLNKKDLVLDFGCGQFKDRGNMGYGGCSSREK